MPEDTPAPPEPDDKPDTAKMARRLKIAGFTTFAAYAAMIGEGNYVRDHILPSFVAKSWQYEILYFSKYTYGAAAGLIFYFLLFHKLEPRATERRRNTAR